MMPWAEEEILSRWMGNRPPHLLKQLQNVGIVHKLDVAPVNLLLLVLLLLALEHMLVEVLLELFVRQVDTELLKAVRGGKWGTGGGEREA